MKAKQFHSGAVKRWATLNAQKKAAILLVSLVVLISAIVFASGDQDQDKEAKNLYILPPADENSDTLTESAEGGEKIVVSPGIYKEQIIFNGKAITLKSIEPNNEEVVASTIIDGDGKGPVFIFNNFETGQTVLQGFTVRNGNSEDNGGGILIQNAAPLITGNIITDNIAEGYGGGIHVQDWSAPTITNNLIANNYSGSGGGGIALVDCLPVTFQNNNLERNHTPAYGAIFIGKHCFIKLGDPDSNSYRNIGISNHYYEPDRLPGGLTNIYELRYYDDLVKNLGEPVEISDFASDLHGDSAWVSYDDAEFYLTSYVHWPVAEFESLEVSLENSRTTIIIVSSDRFSGFKGIRVGDTAASVVTRNRFDNKDAFYFSDEASQLYYEEEDGYFHSGSIRLIEATNEPQVISYASGVEHSCGVIITSYLIENGRVAAIRYARP